MSRAICLVTRGNVATGVKRDGCRATVGVAILLVRTTLSDCSKAQTEQDRDDFTRFQNRDVAHSCHPNGLGADELGLQHWLTVP
jgi:hypothetical protein